MASKQGYGADLRNYMDLRVDLRMNGNRRIIGTMKGYDQYMNIVLDDAYELLKQSKQSKEGKEQQNRPLGMIVIRGASVEFWQNVDKVQ